MLAYTNSLIRVLVQLLLYDVIRAEAETIVGAGFSSFANAHLLMNTPVLAS